MACPFFLPVARLTTDEWIHAPRLPLGDPYRGLCHAAEPFEPAEPDQRELCNCGYAGGRCGRFPKGAADAVRFSIVGFDGDNPRVMWILEKDHAPLEFATIEYRESNDSSVRAAQMRAFVESYRRK